MSKYDELAQAIKGAIVSGDYVMGSRLPATSASCDIYQMSTR